MSWISAITVALVAFLALCGVAFWIGKLLADARTFLDRAERGECTCTRYRLCAVCLRALQGERKA